MAVRPIFGVKKLRYLLSSDFGILSPLFSRFHFGLILVFFFGLSSISIWFSSVFILAVFLGFMRRIGFSFLGRPLPPLGLSLLLTTKGVGLPTVGKQLGHIVRCLSLVCQFSDLPVIFLFQF